MEVLFPEEHPHPEFGKVIEIQLPDDFVEVINECKIGI